MADVWANSMVCHPRATCHIAGLKNSICHLENRSSPYFFCFPDAVWALGRAAAFLSSSIHLL